MRDEIDDDDIYVSSIGIGRSAPLEQLKILAHAFQGYFKDITSAQDQESMALILKDFYEESLLAHKIKPIIYNYIVEGSLIFSKPLIRNGEELLVLGKLTYECYEPSIDNSADSTSGYDDWQYENIRYICGKQMSPLSDISSFNQLDLPLINDKNFNQLLTSIKSEVSTEMMYDVIKLHEKENKIESYSEETTEYFELKNEIMNIAKKHNLVSRFTSLVYTYDDDDSSFAGDINVNLNLHFEDCDGEDHLIRCYYRLTIVSANEYCNEIQGRLENKIENEALNTYKCDPGCKQYHILQADLPHNSTTAYDNIINEMSVGECIHSWQATWCLTDDYTLMKKELQWNQEITQDETTESVKFMQSTSTPKNIDEICSKIRQRPSASRNNKVLVWIFDRQLINYSG